MNSISFPEKWLCVPLLSTCEVKTGKVDANHASDSGKFEFFTCALEPLKADTYSFDGDLIILPGNGANVGHVIFHSGKIEAYQRTYVLHKFVINPKYVYYCLLKNWKEVNLKKQYGSATNYIKMSNFQEFELPLPPLAEQKIIADKLDILVAQVEITKARLERIPEILKTFRQSVLAAAVSGKLTEDWRDSSEYSSVTQLPISWQREKASDVCEKVQSGSTPRNDPFSQNGTVPFLKVYNIVDQKIDFDYKPQFVTKELHNTKLKRSIGFPNDVVMNIVGPPLGKVAILTNQYPEWNLNQAITLFRPNARILNFKYLYFVLCEGELVRAVMPDTKGSVGQVNISLTQCREALIPVPTIEEQAEIVRRVEDIFSFADNIEQKAIAALERVNNLTQSILAKAFRGELTADWREANPDLITGKNSAESLLRKITAEQKKLLANKPRRRKRCNG